MVILKQFWQKWQTVEASFESVALQVDSIENFEKLNSRSKPTEPLYELNFKIEKWQFWNPQKGGKLVECIHIKYYN